MNLVERLRDELMSQQQPGSLYGECLRTIERQAAQIEMMREFIARAPVSSGVCCCGEAIDGHSSPMSCGHSPVDLWDHSVEQILSTTPDQALEQFAAKVREQCEKACESEYVTEVDADDAVYNSAITHALRAIRAFTEIPK